MAGRAAVMAALERRVEQAVVRVAVNVTEKLIEGTPVDTGFARANWTPRTGAPATETSPATQAAGLAEVVSYKLADGSAFVSNHAAYIGFLAKGSSPQAADGWVDDAVAQGVDEARRELA